MRDTRDPSELYDRMMHEMRVHHCSILEAADRVELHRGLAPGSESTSPTIPVTTNGVPLDAGIPQEILREKGIQG